MKFKIGDKVKVVKCNYHTDCANIGEEYVIEKIRRNERKPYCLEGCSELFKEDELELIQAKQFTKSDLKDGDIVTYRNGNTRTIKQNNLLDEDNFEINHLNNFKENLKCKYNENYDIIKVERPLGYKKVFERKEEILDEAEKRYLRGVIRPFRDSVCCIKKMKSAGKYRIKIITQEGNIILSHFSEDEMYINMEEEREYKLKELSL